MNTIDHSTQSFSLFIPTHVLAQRKKDEEIGKWEPINPNKNNWLQDTVWADYVHTLIKLAEDIIVVIFNEEYCEESGIHSYVSAVYKGTLK